MHNTSTEIEQLIREYAQIRKKFEEYKERNPKYLKGNDNYIGIIGEYWATIFLEQEYKNAIKGFLEKKGEGIHSNSEKWLDFILEHDENEGKELISVKAISSENKRSISGKIKYFIAKGEKDILSVIIIKLDDNLIPVQLLYIKDLKSSLETCKWTHYNYFMHWQEGKNDLTFKYYKDDGFDEKAFPSNIWILKDNKFVRK